MLYKVKTSEVCFLIFSYLSYRASRFSINWNFFKNYYACTPQVTNEKMSSSPLLMFSSFGRRWAVIISHLVHALAAAYYEMMIELWKVYNFVHPICSKAKLQSIKQKEMASFFLYKYMLKVNHTIIWRKPIQHELLRKKQLFFFYFPKW